MTYTPEDLKADDVVVQRVERMCRNMGLVIKDWSDIKIEYTDGRGVKHDLGTMAPMAPDNSSINLPVSVLTRLCALAKHDIECRKDVANAAPDPSTLPPKRYDTQLGVGEVKERHSISGTVGDLGQSYYHEDGSPIREPGKP